MLRNLVILTAIIPMLGCTSIRAWRTSDVLRNAASIADAVCTAAPLFEIAGLPHPDKTRCEHALRMLDSDDYKTLVNSYDCVTSNDTWISQKHCLINEVGSKNLALKLSR